MLYLIFGQDTFRSKEKMDEFLSFFRAKIGSLGIFKFEGDSFREDDFEEKLKSQSLFEKKYVVVCERLLENNTAKNFIEKNIEKIVASPNVFIFKEEKVDDKILDLFKEYCQKIQEFKPLAGVKLKKWVEERAKKISKNIQEEIIKECGSDLWCINKEIEKYELGGNFSSEGLTFGNRKYNPFAICDAVAVKDKKRAWLLFQEAILSGLTAEEIFWKIFWQIKNLLMIKRLDQARVGNLEKETKLHPYVIKKTLSAIWNFSEEELINYSFELVKIYHNTRRGIDDISIGLEKFLINLK